MKMCSRECSPKPEPHPGPGRASGALGAAGNVQPADPGQHWRKYESGAMKYETGSMKYERPKSGVEET